MYGLPWKYIIGIALLFTNQPVGWGGILYFTYLGRKTGNKMYYCLGTGIYALSWAMMGLGIFMMGPNGIEAMKNYSYEHKLQALTIFAFMLALGIRMYMWKRKQRIELSPRGTIG